MPRHLKRLWKLGKRAKEAVNAAEDDVQTPGSASELPPETLNSGKLAVINSHTATPTSSEPANLQHRSGESDESKVDDPHGMIPFDAKLGSVLAEGIAPGSPKSTKLDEELSLDAKPRRDLWKEAHERLSQDKQDLLSKIEKVEGSKVIKQLVEQVERKYAERGKGPWKMAFEFTLKSVLISKEIINSAVSCDPTGYAAAAWTVVSLGLQMTQNELDRHQNVLKTCRLLAGTLKLLAAFEASYRVQHAQDYNHQDSKYLEDSIVMVYIAIFELSAEVVHQNAINQKILCSFKRLADQPLQEFTKALSEAQDELRKWADIVEQQSHRGLRRIVNSMSIEMEEMASQVSDMADTILTREEHEILAWLSKYPFDT